MSRLLLVDDHPLFRQALRVVLKWAEPELSVVEANTLNTACDTLSRHRDIELVLLDLKMPDCKGFDGLLKIRRTFPQVPIVMISAVCDAATINSAIGFGAAGFISKSATHTEIMKGLKAVFAGEVWVPALGEEKKAAAKPAVISLTPNQSRILNGLQRGLPNRDIASELGISTATVKIHMGLLFKKLGVANRTQAAMAAQSLTFAINKS